MAVETGHGERPNSRGTRNNIKMTRSFLLFILTAASSASAFAPNPPSTAAATPRRSIPAETRAFAEKTNNERGMRLSMADDAAEAVKSVTGEELEIMLQEWDQPLVLDAYATWCGPCQLMAPELEGAARDLAGKVRFAKLDTELEPQMADRLGVMGLPTLLFLDKNDDEGEEAPMAVLKVRIEGALQKESIMGLCDHHFFGGPMPTQLS